jgi:hypothetical protein
MSGDESGEMGRPTRPHEFCFLGVSGTGVLEALTSGGVLGGVGVGVGASSISAFGVGAFGDAALVAAGIKSSSSSSESDDSTTLRFDFAALGAAFSGLVGADSASSSSAAP